jgi:hypothetical protein
MGGAGLWVFSPPSRVVDRAEVTAHCHAVSLPALTTGDQAFLLRVYPAFGDTRVWS